VSEISAACREQDIGGNQVNQAIQQLDKVTQQNASASEQMSATSEELAAQAEQLQASIAYFRVEQTAVPVARPAPAAPPARVVRKSVEQAPAMTAGAPAARPKPQRGAAPAKGNGHATTGFNLELEASDDAAQDRDFVRF